MSQLHWSVDPHKGERHSLRKSESAGDAAKNKEIEKKMEIIKQLARGEGLTVLL